MSISHRFSDTPTARLIRNLRAIKQVGKDVPLELLPKEPLSPAEALQLSQLRLKAVKPQLREEREAKRKIIEREKRRAEIRLKRRQQAERRSMCGASAKWHREGERQADEMRRLISKIEYRQTLRAAIAETKRIREAEAKAAEAKAQAEAQRKADRVASKRERDAEYLSDPQAMAKHLARAAKRSSAPQATV